MNPLTIDGKFYLYQTLVYYSIILSKLLTTTSNVHNSTRQKARTAILDIRITIFNFCNVCIQCRSTQNVRTTTRIMCRSFPTTQDPLLQLLPTPPKIPEPLPSPCLPPAQSPDLLVSSNLVPTKEKKNPKQTFTAAPSALLLLLDVLPLRLLMKKSIIE